jgi:ubiquinone/menaquinone biosynthesis C-methylase UbiE
VEGVLVSFKQYLIAEVIAGLDETYKVEDWEKEYPGKQYFDLHINTIEEHERATETFRKYLGGGGMKILESGCGSGRWMAYFEKLGNRSYGVDDSPGPLGTARAHDPTMNLTRADALATPLKSDSFDAAFSSYVAEHFEEGPEELFREIHRVLKPGGLFFVVVPYNNTLRRYLINPILMVFWKIWKIMGWGLGFTEFRYTREEMDGFLRRTNFETIEVLPDDYYPPWAKGLFCDVCDLGCFVGYEHKPPYEFGRVGRAINRLIRSFGIWQSCGGIFYVCRAVK